ncbi:Endocytic & GEF Adapter [Abortiporus biennis]
MKAFLHRINRGLSKEKHNDKEPPVHKEKIPQLPPLREWPPQQQSAATPTSLSSFKPLPDISRPLPPIEEPSSSESPASSSTPTPTVQVSPLPSVPVNTSPRDAAQAVDPPAQIAPSRSEQSRSESDYNGRSSRKATNGSVHPHSASNDVQKKVAFISLPPTPGPSLDKPLPSSDTPVPSNGAPTKTTVSRFQASHGKDPRGSTSTAASSKTDVASTVKSAKAASTRTATSPYTRGFDGVSLHQSMRSTTPYSQMSQMSAASSRILSVQSWSESAEEDLVSNLGQRERTRQEVLWEIVASEERYVTELLKLKETFIDPLLHPYSTSPVTSPTNIEYEEFPGVESPRESLDHLPIASRFLSPLGFRSDSPTSQVAPSSKKDDAHQDTPNMDGESMNSDEEGEAEDRLGKGYPSSRIKSAMSMAAKHNHPRSPYGTSALRGITGKGNTSVPFPSRSHQSLPPPPRVNPMTASSQSLGRQSLIEQNHPTSPPPRVASSAASSRVLRKFKKSNPSPPIAINGAISPKELPEDLRKCLEVIEGGILQGHMRLSEGLLKRYEEQYPLVRSLADVFVSNSHILHGYATYVLHLERALEQVDNALSTQCANKKPKKQDAEQWFRICQYLQKLESISGEKGETGLAISLSKPFQRLLKYPLLFQNLLYHTDPSTYEYESTLQMVAEVETIVRSIEDEKIQKEERDKTRDVFARIEGLDKVKQLMVPKPSRVLMEERPVIGVNPLGDSLKASSPPPTSQNPRGVKGKTSLKRLSDVLQAGSNGVGGKKDQWLVVFNDVVLRCQRTGTTSLPLVAATNSRTTSLPELQGKAKYATTGRRNSHTKPRNLYKFIKIETWAIGDVVQPKEGVVSMEDVVRSRQQVHSGVQPRIVPLPEDDDEEGGESDDSDRKSKMSFSYWGADKVTLQKPVVKPRQVSGNGPRRGSTNTATTAYARESSANAKFGTRLVSADNAHGGPRPASRRTQATPISRRPAQSDEGHSVKVTVTRDRPAWDGSTRANANATPVPKRSRNVSQTSAAATRTPVSAATKLASPAPSEDSGVGLYRNLMLNDPSLNP